MTDTEKKQTPFDKIGKIIENELTKQFEKNKIILDLSTFSYLDKIFQKKIDDEIIKIFIPDTIKRLALRTEENKNYYLYKLIDTFSYRMIDPKYLTYITSQKKFDNIEIHFITERDVDERVYSFCKEHFLSKGLMVEFSPRFNILGDYIGKILGAAKKLNLTVLMMNERLLSKIHWTIPVINLANVLDNEKVKFFEKYIPYVKPTRGLRWILAGLISTTEYSPFGCILWIVDP